jgi:tetratricopeptide (TPR) repeat protein
MLEDFKLTLKFDPNNVHAALSLAMYAFNKSLWSEAVTGFTRYLMIEPNSANGFSHRGRAFANLKNWEEALSVCSISLEDCKEFN